MKVTFRAKLVVDYCNLVPMESGSDNVSEKYIATVTKDLE